MKKEFVTYPIAVKLKELGFDKKCFGCYISSTLCIVGDEIGDFIASDYENRIKAPLWQQAIDWFREKHEIHIQFGMQEFKKWCFGIQYIDSGMVKYPRIAKSNVWDINDYEIFREAREQAILKAIEICQKQK